MKAHIEKEADERGVSKFMGIPSENETIVQEKIRAGAD